MRPEDVGVVSGHRVSVALLLASSRVTRLRDAARQHDSRHRRTNHVARLQRIVAVVAVGDAVDRQVHQCLVTADDLSMLQNRH